MVQVLVYMPSSVVGDWRIFCPEFKFTEEDFCLNRGLSADFLTLLFTKEYTSYLKCVVVIIRGRVWFGTDFGG